MSKKNWGICAVSGLLFFAVPAAAHHAVQAQHDFDKPIEFTGKLVKMEWISPHSILGFAARNGHPMGFLREIGMPDGRRMVMWFGDPNGN